MIHNARSNVQDNVVIHMLPGGETVTFIGFGKGGYNMLKYPVKGVKKDGQTKRRCPEGEGTGSP